MLFEILGKSNETIIVDEINLMWNIDHVLSVLLIDALDEIGVKYDTEKERSLHLRSAEWNKAVDTLTNLFKQEIEINKPKYKSLAWIEHC